MRDGERAQRAHCIDEERVWAVERVDEAGVLRDLGPARGLNGAGNFEGEFVKIVFAIVPVDFAFAHEAPKISVGRDVVEAVIVDADVRDVRGHFLDSVRAAGFEEFSVAGGVELEQSRAELEALGPFGPTARGVFSVDCENGRALVRVPRFFNGRDFSG